MSVQAMSWVLDHSESELASRLVLLAIANHCDAEGLNSFPSQAKLAREAHVSERTVRRCVSELVKSGELTVRRHQGMTTGNGRTHYYELSGYIATLDTRPDCPPAPADTRTDEVDTRTSATPNPDTCGRGTVLEPSVEPSSSAPTVTDAEPGLSVEDEEVFRELAHLKLDSRGLSAEPITDRKSWFAKVIATDAEDGELRGLLSGARAAWTDATTEQLARYLYDGTEPHAQRLPTCPVCCDEFESMDAMTEHYADCSDPDFLPAGSIPTSGGPR